MSQFPVVTNFQVICIR